MISNLKFRKILNDIKRRPIDAAKDLDISKEQIDNYLEGKEQIPFSVVRKAVDIWPVNYNEFFNIIDDTISGYKKMTKSESDNSQRVMERSNKPYYLYKDTATSKLAPFKPEWIEELLIVDNNDPENKSIVFNNGHFLHQFTYFIGEVNFYYIVDEIKYVAVMNTGDSMYISPYIPHSFATRKNDKNVNGIILALTYADKLDHHCIDELSAIGKDLSLKFKMNLENELESFKSNLKYYLDVASLSLEELISRTKINDIDKVFILNRIPSFDIISKIANAINVNVRDLLPIYNDAKVKIQKYSNCNTWHYPSKKNKKYTFIELAWTKKLPLSRAYELHVNEVEKSNLSESIVITPLHQYIFNVGSTKCQININQSTIEIEPNDSIYIKPNLALCFDGIGSKLLILRVGGKISGDVLYHLSMIDDNNLSRSIEDNIPWFNQ